MKLAQRLILFWSPVINCFFPLQNAGCHSVIGIKKQSLKGSTYTDDAVGRNSDALPSKETKPR